MKFTPKEIKVSEFFRAHKDEECSAGEVMAGIGNRTGWHKTREACDSLVGKGVLQRAGEKYKYKRPEL